MIRFVLLFVVTLILTVGGLSWYLWHTNLPLLSPMDVIASLTPESRLLPQTKKVVYGFLPYWNLKYSDQIPIRYLTHLAYFGVDLDTNGGIKFYESPGVAEPGLHKLSSSEFSILHRQLKLVGKKSILLVRAFDPDQIETIVNNPDITDKSIRAVMDIVVTKQFDGINVDFEYVGSPSEATRRNFATYVAKLAAVCRSQISGCEISIDVFADAAAKDRLWDLKALSQTVDQVIVMAYDFYRPSSNQAGPVAPLRGACQEGQVGGKCLDYDVTESMVDILKLVPAEKILMGIPFYGYEWQTAGPAFLANTYERSGATASYKRIQELLAQPDNVSSISAKWNVETLSPYLVYEEDGGTYQVHYEDSRSLSLKLDLVNQTGLGGIAIWALGYETPYMELWQTIGQKFYD